MKWCLLLFLAGCLNNVFAQEIMVMTQTGKTFPKSKADAPFHFIEQGADTSRLTFMATWKVLPPENKSIEAMYNKVSDLAKKTGGNAFRLRNLDPVAVTFMVDIYHATDEGLNHNETLKSTNIIYVFAGEQHEKTEYYTFELNGAPTSIKNGTYFMYTLKEGEQVKLKKGTVSGTTLWIKWKTDQPSHYLSIHGFYNEPVVKRTTVSQSFKPGKFLPVDKSLGRFLVAVLKPSE